MSLEKRAVPGMFRFVISMSPADIVYLSWTIGSYEGIGYVSTDDPKTGTVSVYTTSGNQDIMKKIINAIATEGLDLRIIDEIGN